MDRDGRKAVGVILGRACFASSTLRFLPLPPQLVCYPFFLSKHNIHNFPAWLSWTALSTEDEEKMIL
jgi:hypothetical protein